MKKLLLGTTALTGVMLSAVAAQAAEPMALTISGFFEGVVIAGDDDIAGSRNIAFNTWNSEIQFDAKGVTDGGLTYGFHVELEGITSGDQIDEAYLYFSGGFGKLEFGATDSVGAKTAYVAPSPEPTGIINLNSPDYFPNNGVGGLTTVTTFLGFGGAFETGDRIKLNYFTPRLAGFQLGVTYSPNPCEDAGCFATTTTGGFLPKGGAGTVDAEYIAAVNYARDFANVSVGASAGFSKVTERGSPLGTSDEEGYSAGLNLGIGLGAGTATVGGSYLAYRDWLFIQNADYDAFDLGARYAVGPWTAGVSYINGDTNNTGGDLTTWALAIGAGYSLAPGLALAAGYEHYDRDAGAGSSQKANTFLLGTELSF